jgi:hypothetical protein
MTQVTKEELAICIATLEALGNSKSIYQTNVLSALIELRDRRLQEPKFNFVEDMYSSRHAPWGG